MIRNCSKFNDRRCSCNWVSIDIYIFYTICRLFITIRNTSLHCDIQTLYRYRIWKLLITCLFCRFFIVNNLLWRLLWYFCFRFFSFCSIFFLLQVFCLRYFWLFFLFFQCISHSQFLSICKLIGIDIIGTPINRIFIYSYKGTVCIIYFCTLKFIIFVRNI